MEKLNRALEEKSLIGKAKFKTVHFEGEGDVDYFIQRFQQIAEANRWRGRDIQLHLRQALDGKAKDCRQAEGVAEIFAALRVRFGQTVKQATSRLTTLQRKEGTTPREHADVVKCLVDTAYPEVDEINRQRIRLTVFQTTLADAPFQRHLLAVDPANLEGFVCASRDYDQVKGKEKPETTPPASGEVRTVQTKENTVDRCLTLVHELTQKCIPQAPPKKAPCMHPPPKDSGNEDGRRPHEGWVFVGLTPRKPSLGGRKLRGREHGYFNRWFRKAGEDGGMRSGASPIKVDTLSADFSRYPD